MYIYIYMYMLLPFQQPASQKFAKLYDLSAAWSALYFRRVIVMLLLLQDLAKVRRALGRRLGLRPGAACANG